MECDTCWNPLFSKIKMWDHFDSLWLTVHPDIGSMVVIPINPDRCKTGKAEFYSFVQKHEGKKVKTEQNNELNVWSGRKCRIEGYWNVDVYKSTADDSWSVHPAFHSGLARPFHFNQVTTNRSKAGVPWALQKKGIRWWHLDQSRGLS